MSKIGLSGLLFALVAACGGSKQTRPAEPATAMREEPIAAPAEPTGEESAATDDVNAMDHTMPTPAVEEPAPAPKPVVAVANLTKIKGGDAMGMVTFTLGDDGKITIDGRFNGLSKNKKHAFYIHEGGDCTGGDKTIGKHLDPTGAKHGMPSASDRHAGDFGNLEADANGEATFSMVTDSLTMTDIGRADTIMNRTIVIHAKPDDKKGSGGAALACGVIKPQEDVDASTSTSSESMGSGTTK